MCEFGDMTTYPGIATQIAFHRRTDIGCWSHGRQILLMLGQRWPNGGLPTTT